MNKYVETHARQRFFSCLDTIKSDMNNRDLYIWGLCDGGRIAIALNVKVVVSITRTIQKAMKLLKIIL